MGRLILKNAPPEEYELSIEEIEEAAQTSKTIPENLDAPGRMLFLGLFRLYNLSKLNLIDKESFEKTRRRLIKDYEENRFNYKMWSSILGKMQKASNIIARARKEKSYEAVMEAIDIIFG